MTCQKHGTELFLLDDGNPGQQVWLCATCEILSLRDRIRRLELSNKIMFDATHHLFSVGGI